MRRARISSGGVRSRSSFFTTERGGCFGTRDVYYGVAPYATPRWRLPCLAPKARHSLAAWGSAPGFVKSKNPSALKARFTSGARLIIIDTMPQSVSKVILHIIFSTKNREPWLDSSVRPRVHAYLATVCRDVGAELVRVGGVADHIHIITTLPRTLSQAQFIEQIKKASSKWIKGLDVRYRGFFWQRGYGAFSVSPSQLDAVLQYVESQEEPTCGGRGFRNDGAIYLNVIDLILEIDAIRLSPGECQSQDERRLVDSRSGREGESQDCSRAVRNRLGRADLGKRRSSICADQK